MTAPAWQVKRVHVEFTRLRVTDRDAKLRALSAVLYHPVESSRDLTPAEAQVAIATLRNLPDSAALDRMVTEAEARMGAAT